MFGVTPLWAGVLPAGMSFTAEHILDGTDAPDDGPVQQLDVRNLGPPKPLAETLETLADMEVGVLVQLNDRAPQHLYPKLADRGYEYETVETDEATVTVIWEP